MSCSGSHLGITINIKNTKFVKDLPMIDAQFRYIGPYGKNVSKRFFSETTWTIETKLPRKDHWKVLYKIFVFYADRKSKMATTAEHRSILDPKFHIEAKNLKFEEDHPMNIHVQFGFNHICSF
jgi:hypothetical protein